MMKLQPTKLVLALLLVVGVSFAGRPFEFSKDKLQKTASNDVATAIDINNVFNYYVNNGDGALNPFTGDDGFEIFSANRGQVLFEEGFVWGGVHKGLIKIGGSTYNHGLQAGPITVTGDTTKTPKVLPAAASAADAQYHVYKSRPDIGPKQSFTDVAVRALLDDEVVKLSRYENTTAKQLYDQYVADWNAWPAAQGAPYTDVNGNGKYDAGTDIPGVTGADQTLWYVANDLDTARVFRLAGSKPIGIEFQRTIWAYNRAGAIGNTIFQKNIIINKSGYRVDSMFVAQWADPDVGGSLGYTDDFSGCDTIRSLGMTYNGTNNDGFFGAAPPAMGFDFFQGPLVKTGVPTDRAIYKGAYKYGYKNLGMTGFNFSVNSSSTYADATLNAAAGTQEWYNQLNGLVGRTGAPYVNPKTGQASKFVLSGDPVTGIGWIDGTIAPPGDRRMSLCSGPFTMAPGDTQEVVVAAMAAQSTNRLASVALLKYYDDQAQSAYNNFFSIPQAPAIPTVVVSELDKEIILDWSAPANYTATESQNSNGYKFEGYNVYQLPTKSFANQKLLATYDLVNGVYTIADQVFSEQFGTTVLVPVESGSDNGIQRFFDVTSDVIGGKPLVNGQAYYFAVTAYNYNPDPKAVPITLETAPVVKTVIPQAPIPGNRINSEVSDAVTVNHSAGKADATVTFKVVNPKNITGHDYEVSIVVNDSIGTGFPKAPNSKWLVTDKTTGTVVLAANNNYVINTTNPVVDGIQLGFKASPFWVSHQEVSALLYAKAGTDINTVKGTTASMPTSNWTGINNGLAYFGGGFDCAANFLGSALPASQTNRKIEVRFGAAGSGQKAYVFTRTATSGSGGAPYTGFYTQPFTVWDITDAATPRQVDFWFMEVDGSALKNTIWTPGAATGGTDREYLFISNDTYTATEKPEFAGKTLTVASAAHPLLYAGWFILKDATKSAYDVGDVWRIVPTGFLTTSDKWTYSTASLAPSFNADLKKADVQNINVFPNPYFGFNPKEANKYVRFVTFNHLPDVATLNIVNLAGVRVRTLLKNDLTQFMNWDLKNEQGLPVAAGMYVIYIDMGALGTKIVKLGIIPEVQQLDKY